MAAMLTCGDFRNEKRVGFFNQQACVATARTRSAKAGKGAPEPVFSCGAGYEIGESERCGHTTATRLAYPRRCCLKTVLYSMR